MEIAALSVPAGSVLSRATEADTIPTPACTDLSSTTTLELRTIAALPSARENTLEHDLANLAIALLTTLLVDRDYDAALLVKHFSKNAINRTTYPDPDLRWETTSRAQMLSTVSQLAGEIPNMSFQIYEDLVVAKVDETLGKGIVWVPAYVKGALPGEEGKVRREWVMRMQFRWKGNASVGSGGYGRWVCERQVGISASGGFMGVP